MGKGRSQPGGGGVGGHRGPNFRVRGAGFRIWASGYTRTSGFSALRCHGGEVGCNSTMRYVFSTAMGRRSLIDKCISVKCNYPGSGGVIRPNDDPFRVLQLQGWCVRLEDVWRWRNFWFGVGEGACLTPLWKEGTPCFPK